MKKKSSKLLVLMVTVGIVPLGCASPKGHYISKESMDVDLSKDSDATLISDEEPLRFPAKAIREKVSGYAVVTFVVGKTGQPREIEIIKEEPTGFGFGDAAVRQVSSLQFKPAVLNGERVRQRMKRRFTFMQK